MSVENERKLLLRTEAATELYRSLRQATASYHLQFFDITQGYLSGSARVRHVVPHSSADEQFIFTYKTKVQGATVEIETDLPIHDYQKLFLIVKPVIVKTRVKIPDGNINWDVDFFKTPKQGTVYLTMAEAEMPEFETENPPIHPLLEPYALRWVDVGDKRFNNRQLANAKKVNNLLKDFGQDDKTTLPKHIHK